MKNTLLYLFIIIYQGVFANNPLPIDVNPANGFIENKGQIVDMNGKLIPNVLFKNQSIGLDLYITDSGLTYLFKNIRKEPKHQDELTDKEKLNVLNGGKTPTNKFIDWERVDVTFIGSNIQKENILSKGNINGYYNYYCSNKSKGVTNIKEYKEIRLNDIYPNIDWVLYNTSEHGLKYDFILKKGAKFKDILVEYSSKNNISISSSGDIIIKTSHGEFTEKAPVSFFDGEKVFSAYKIKESKSNNHGGTTTIVQYEIDEDVPEILGDRELVIDPILAWNTFYGGNEPDGLTSITEDNNGFMVIGGYVSSTDFPVGNETNYYSSSSILNGDEVLIKMDKNGNIIWTTIIGGDEFDYIKGIDITSNNEYVIGGFTSSLNLYTLDAGGYYSTVYPGGIKASFIGSLTENGYLNWHSFLTEGSLFSSLIVDSQDNIYYTSGEWGSSVGVYLPGAYYSPVSSNGSDDVMLMKFDSGKNLIWSTEIPGTESISASLDIDSQDNLFLGCISSGWQPYSGWQAPVLDAGTYYKPTSQNKDLLLLKFDPSGALLWGTYFGGDTSWERKCSIIIDENDELYVSGETQSSDFPLLDNGGTFHSTPTNTISTIVSKFDNTGTLLWSTYFNMGASLHGRKIKMAISPCENNLVLQQITYSNSIGTVSMPTLAYSANSFIYPEKQGTNFNMVQFNEANELIYATYFDGDGVSFRGDITVDSENDIWMVGEWVLDYSSQISSYPFVQGPGYFDNTPNGSDDSFIAKFKSENLNIVETNEEIIFCDSILIDNDWYYNAQTISLHIENKHGCDSVIQNITLKEECLGTLNPNIHIPNVLTPNNDGSNDSFYISEDGSVINENAKLYIYNRWGRMVFTSTKEMEWKPSDQPSGVYYYLFEYKGQVHKGYVSLIKYTH